MSVCAGEGRDVNPRGCVNGSALLFFFQGSRVVVAANSQGTVKILEVV